MTTPKRLLEAEGTDIELRLLGAARDEAPSKALEARMRAGLGLPFALPGPASDFPPAPAPTSATTSGGAAQGAAQAASQAAAGALAGQIAASQIAAGQAASGAAAMSAAGAGASTGLSWAKVLVGVALLGGFGAAAFSVASGNERDTAKSGVVTARAPGEPGAPAAASPPPSATPSSTTLSSTTRPSTTLPSTANNPSTASGSGAAATTEANALVDGSPSDGAQTATVGGTTTAAVTSSANAPTSAARAATTSAGSTAARSAVVSAAGSSVAGATAPRATALAAGAPSSSASRETALNEEIRLVDSMRSALAQGDGALALSRAAAYRSRFPAGTLREEVEALRIEATRQSGDAKRADALAERFANEHPTSPHLGRVRGATSGAATSPKR